MQKIKSSAKFSDESLHLFFQELVLSVDCLAHLLSFEAIYHFLELFLHLQTHHFRLRNTDIVTVIASRHRSLNVHVVLLDDPQNDI